MLRVIGRLPVRPGLRALAPATPSASGSATTARPSSSLPTVTGPDGAGARNAAFTATRQYPKKKKKEKRPVTPPKRAEILPEADRWTKNQVDALQKRKAILQALAGQGNLGDDNCQTKGRPTRREYALGLHNVERCNIHDPAPSGERAPRTLHSARFNDQTNLLELVYDVQNGSDSGTPFTVSTSALWMRDLCQCSQCVTPSSGQKAILTHDLEQHPKIKRLTGRNAAGKEVPVTDTAAPVAAADVISTLVITWDDGEPLGSKSGGEHESVYDAADLLLKLSGLFPPVVPALPRRVLWDRTQIGKLQRPVQYADWMATTAEGKTPEFYRALTDLHQLGLVVVDGVPDAETAVRDIASEIGHVQPTFYGELFDVVSKPPTEAENVAYTNVHLGLHQDLLYMNDPPRIQLLHCLRNDCEGGESLFSDSLRAAVEMQLRFPYYVLALAQFRVPYHYERNGNFYFNERRVFDMDPENMPAADSRPNMLPEFWDPFYNKLIKHTAWSPPFQGTFQPATLVDDDTFSGTTAGGERYKVLAAVNLERMSRMSQEEQAIDYKQRFKGLTRRAQLEYWHEAVRVFEDLLNSERHLFEFKLQPGQCVLFDNRRVLHGRRQFSPVASQNKDTDRPRWLKGTYVSDQVFRSRVMGMVRSGQAPADTLPPPLSWTPGKALLDEQMQVLAMLEAEGKPLWDDVQVQETRVPIIWEGGRPTQGM